MANYEPEQDIEFLRSKLEQLNQEIVPSHRISPEIMLQKLDDMQSAVTAKRVWFVPKNIAVVLCAGLVLCIALFYVNKLPNNLATASVADSGDLVGFGIMGQAENASQEEAPSLLTDDYTAVRKALSKTAQYAGGETPKEDEAKGGGGAETGGNGDTERTETPFASATVQSEQTDIVQTDGSYLYYAAGDAVKIAQTAADGTLSFVSQLDTLADDRYVISVYQQEDWLTLLCNDYSFTITQPEQGADALDPIQSVGTTVLMFDITDRSQPVLLRQFTQEGAYRSSLVTENTLYLVSERQTFEYSDALPIAKMVPSVYDTAKGEATRPIGAGAIIVPEIAADASYVTVSALDLYDSGTEVVTRTVLGGAEQVYCSPDGVVLVNPVQIDGGDGSELLKLSFASSGTVDVARTQLSGRLLGLDDAANGSVNVVTQHNGSQTEALFNAFTLDNSLAVLGSTTASVALRGGDVTFVGETAYVGAKEDGTIIAAFDFAQQAVPQALVDLPKAALPDNLVFLSDTLALGLYSADVTGTGQGVQLALFDIKNNQFTVTSTQTIGASGSFTEALRSLDAVLYDKANALVGIPVAVTSGAENKQLKQEYSGYHLYRIEDGKLTPMGSIKSVSASPQDALLRGVLVDGVLYAVSDNSLISADAKTLSVIDTLEWGNR